METIKFKEQADNLIEQLSENFRWHDRMYAIYLRKTEKSYV
ncbi:hypothetical protein QUB68_01225 [Microcoleus sp. A006_D1]